MASHYKPKTVWGIVKNTGTPLDGLKLVLTQWEYDNHGSWHLSGWNDPEDSAVMRTMHDTDELYSDMPIDDFEKLWKSKEYEPEGSFCLELDQVEIVEVINEEQKEEA